MEKSVLVRCRPEDKDLVQQVLKDASNEFTELIKNECGVNFTCNVQFDEHNPLGDNVAE